MPTVPVTTIHLNRTPDTTRTRLLRHRGLVLSPPHRLHPPLLCLPPLPWILLDQEVDHTITINPCLLATPRLSTHTSGLSNPDPACLVNLVNGKDIQ
jgi:hypothetical protein